MNGAGKISQLSSGTIEKVRNAWEGEINAPDPPDALKEIDKSGAVLLITGQTELRGQRGLQSSRGGE
jgi:hypothetical protein